MKSLRASARKNNLNKNQLNVGSRSELSLSNSYLNACPSLLS
jgi:hypothetical protein